MRIGRAPFSPYKCQYQTLFFSHHYIIYIIYESLLITHAPLLHVHTDLAGPSTNYLFIYHLDICCGHIFGSTVIHCFLL